MANYTAGNHKEIPDNTPVELPLGYRPPETLESMISRLVRLESARAEAEGNETFEEADDFELDDDSDLVSPYQLTDMQEELPHESKQLRPGNNGRKRKPDPTPEPESAEEPEEKPAPKVDKKAGKLAAPEGVANETQ